MSDGREREDLGAPWTALRDVGAPSPGAKARVRRRLEAYLQGDAAPRRRVRRWPLVVVAAALLLVAGRGLRDGGRRGGARGAGSGTLPPGADAGALVALAVPLAEGPVRTQPLSVVAGKRVEVPLHDGHVSVHGPADVAVEERRVVLRSGTVDTLGRVDVAGPSCEAHVDGTAQVSVVKGELVVRVFAGSAEVVPPVASCHVIELPAPGAPAAPRERERERVGQREPRRGSAAAGARSPLADEVSAYRAALALEAVDPAAALHAWRAAQARWPDGALAHEIDLHVLRMLVRLGQVDEAHAAARAFLRRHPDSARAGEVRALVTGGTP